MKCLVVFSYGRLDFRHSEFMSVLELYGIEDAKCQWSETNSEETSFMLCELPSEQDAKKIAERCMSIKAVYELWGFGRTLEELGRDIETTLANQPTLARYLVAEDSFKIDVQCLGGTLSFEEQQERRNWLFTKIPFNGTVKLKDPDHMFLMTQDQGVTKEDRGKPPKSFFFGREIGVSQRGNLIQKYELKKRGFLCTTSMNAELSFIVSNFAHAGPGKFIMDPFCGSGSLLVSCSHFGANVIGGEIDWRVLVGEENNSKLGHDSSKTIWTNFADYGLPQPIDMIRCDMGHCAWNTRPMLDAIVCDPPYGIRAGGRTAGSIRTVERISEKVREMRLHFPGTVAYPVVNVLEDLMDFSSKRLVVGGRLVYFLPSTEEYQDQDVPSHPCFEVRYNCDEWVTSKWRRRLITLVKVREWEVGMKAECPLGIPAHADLAAKIMNDPMRKDDRVIEKKKKYEKNKQQQAAAAAIQSPEDNSNQDE